MNRLAVAFVMFGISSLFGEAVLPTGNGTCTYFSYGFTQNCPSAPNVSQLPGLGNNLTGVSFSLGGNGSVTSFDSSSSTPHARVTFTSSGNITGSGLTSGVTVPFMWIFNLSIDTTTVSGTSIGAITGGYTVRYDIQTGGSSIFASTPTFTGTNASHILGQGSAVTTSAILSGTPYTLTAILDIDWSRTLGTPGLVVNIPSGSLDIGRAPEPASMMLLGAPLLAVLALHRRRRSA